MKLAYLWLLAATLTLAGALSRADDYSDTVALFKNAGESAEFFNNCYGYAVFPGIGKGGLVVGGAHGNGRVYVHGHYTGDVSMTQVSVGLQAGGEAYRQVIFFENKGAFDEFTKGDYEFDAGAQAVVITAAANAGAGTNGTSAGASGGEHDARTKGRYYKGMAVFDIVKGGAMAGVTVAGQKFKYTPRSS
jgi:lipid-binding SYLF domain-containing protein